MDYAKYNICPSPTLNPKLSSPPARKKSIKRYDGFSRGRLMQSNITPRRKRNHWNQPNRNTYKKSERHNKWSPLEVDRNKRKKNPLNCGDLHSWATSTKNNHRAMQQLSIWPMRQLYRHNNLVSPLRPIMS